MWIRYMLASGKVIDWGPDSPDVTVPMVPNEGTVHLDQEVPDGEPERFIYDDGHLIELP